MSFESDFYKTDAWKEARKERLALDNHTCKCGSKTQLQVHHVTSISKGGAKTAMYNLVVLCVNCHNKVHPHLYNNKSKAFKPTRIKHR
jgi:5-methylcytosine-specific restriction endonuclease McrA